MVNVLKLEPSDLSPSKIGWQRRRSLKETHMKPEEVNDFLESLRVRAVDIQKKVIKVNWDID